MNFIQVVLAVIELVKIVEKMLPESGQGAAKLELVRKFLEEAMGDVSAVWPQIQNIVAVFVKIANAVGTFKK